MAKSIKRNNVCLGCFLIKKVFPRQYRRLFLGLLWQSSVPIPRATWFIRLLYTHLARQHLRPLPPPPPLPPSIASATGAGVSAGAANAAAAATSSFANSTTAASAAAAAAAGAQVRRAGSDGVVLLRRSAGLITSFGAGCRCSRWPRTLPSQRSIMCTSSPTHRLQCNSQFSFLWSRASIPITSMF